MTPSIYCPECSTELLLPRNLFGLDVRCPSCETVFNASARDVVPATAECPSCKAEVPDADDRCPGCGAELEPVRAADRPADAFGTRRDGEPHRAGLVLTLGIVCLVTVPMACPCCTGIGLIAGLPTGVAAIVMGRTDLRRIRRGEVDPSGRHNTVAGITCAIIGLVLHALIGGAFLVLLLSNAF